ncbi:MAG: phage tail protein [Phascolarctobacterium sp.]|nr:phage tail protein [Candidatus Phascolarctobacterium caballi]
MAKIGSFGDLVFSVSDNTVRTFDKLSWKVSAKYATHDRHIKRDVMEFLGPEPASIDFQMAFSVFHGTNPLNEIKKLNKMVNKGITARLVLGGKKYGSYKWVITSVSSELEKYDNKGNCWAATAKVTLKEYPKR